ncbi:MAG TPA: hypothetical protein VLY63_32635, partial [Anaerolineae bacterium]|nr:hypothetical protein [Anaerolineae bacterium]
GDWAAGTTGVSNDVKVRRFLEEYIGRESKQWAEKPPVDDPIEFIVPVWGPGANNNPPATGWVPTGVITDGTGCGKATPTSMHGQFYNVVGFAKMQLLGYKLSQGDSWDPWISPTECITYGVAPPNGGNRLTAAFREWVQGSGGTCDSVSTVSGLSLED